jgi:pimeloyl-ACP methyl ester carboxylesterase
VLDRLDERRIRFEEPGGVRTRVYDGGGDGEPLVLIHGGDFGSPYSLDAWSLVLPGLARQFRVVAFDKLGQGYTADPASESEHTWPPLFRHAVSLLDELALGPAHLVGHSMGALLATRIAFERPELARTLVIVDSNTTAPDDPRYPWSAFYDDLAARMPAGPPTRESIRMEPEEQSWSPEHVTDDFVERLLAVARLRPSSEKAWYDPIWMPSIMEMRRRNLAEIDAGGVPVPTLVAWGADDPSAPVPLAYALFERIAAKTAEAELHVLGRAGHYAYREQPRAFVRLLEAFCLGRAGRN